MTCKEKYQWFGDMLIKAFKSRSDFGFMYVTAGCGSEHRIDIWFNDLRIYTGVIAEKINRERTLNKRQAKKYIAKIKEMVRQAA